MILKVVYCNCLGRGKGFLKSVSKWCTSSGNPLRPRQTERKTLEYTTLLLSKGGRHEKDLLRKSE